MSDIEHNMVLTELLLTEISIPTEELKLGVVDDIACRNVRAEKECNASYARGREQTVQYREHIANLEKFIRLVDQTFRQTDQQAARENAEGDISKWVSSYREEP